MRELQDILAAARQIFQGGGIATLATVVHVEGSSYRLPGARMLIDSAGQRVGSVSGGCLEADVARRGRLLTAADPTTVVRYDGSDEDVAWGFGLGCNGSIQVFIERLDKMPPALHFIQQCFDRRQRGAMVSIFKVDGDIADRPGSRLMMTADETQRDCLAAHESFLHADAAQCLASGESTTVTYELPTGSIHALVEAISPPLPLIIFGAGHDALPLSRAAKSLGWHVTVWDRRAGYARTDHFPDADAVSAADPTTLTISPDTAAVVMTHHYPDDRLLLPMLLKSPAKYVGMLGPRVRTDRILSEMKNEGFTPTPAQLKRLHAPIGLDIGAEGPEQVAVSVIAEILATVNTRSGGSLRGRHGPIHPPAKSRTISPVQPIEPARTAP